MLDIDVNEPPTATSLISPAVPCSVQALNAHDWADYRWQGVDGQWVNVERKTWGEILSNVDAVEDQLRRHMTNQPQAHLVFIMEGWVVEHMAGTQTVKQSGSKPFYLPEQLYSTRLARIWSWLYAAGGRVQVLMTGNYSQTCGLLVAAYKQDQKSEGEHKIFQRHYKKVDWHPNPQVQKLMGLEPGLGEVRATALINQFVTVNKVLTASVSELCTVGGIGKVLATRLLSGIGRTDVG